MVKLATVIIASIFFTFLKETVAEDSCVSNSECPRSTTTFERQLCCRGYFSFSERRCRNIQSCRGRYCKNNGECSGECCVSNSCSDECPACKTKGDCKTGEFCCRSRIKNLDRCATNCLGEYCSNRIHCAGPQECCRSNVCVNCSAPGCRDDYQCAEGQYCCDNGGTGKSFCNSTCIGASCTHDYDCGAESECCHENKCVACSSLKCNSNEDCTLGNVCCRRKFFENSRCKSRCIGEPCHTSRDCGGSDECCRDEKCSKCSESVCKDNSECRQGHYCCKIGKRCLTNECIQRTIQSVFSGTIKPRHAVCLQSCIGQSCSSNDHCGGPGECCMGGICSSTNGSEKCCSSNEDCGTGEYCCTTSTNRGCDVSCIGKNCFSDSDCGAPGEECAYSDLFCHKPSKTCREYQTKCFNASGCNSHGQCSSAFGAGYYCCKDGSSCNSNCLEKYCDEDGDCASTECCDSNKRCKKCPNDGSPAWAIGLSVGISVMVFFLVIASRRCYLKRKLQRTTGEPQLQNSDLHNSSRGENVDSSWDAIVQSQSTNLAQYMSTILSQLTVNGNRNESGPSAPPPDYNPDYHPSEQTWSQDIANSVVPSAPPMPDSNSANRAPEQTWAQDLIPSRPAQATTSSNDDMHSNDKNTNGTVAPSAPPLCDSIPSCPPPSYEQLFGNASQESGNH